MNSNKYMCYYQELEVSLRTSDKISMTLSDLDEMLPRVEIWEDSPVKDSSTLKLVRE